jgi:hypothetical protein
MKRTEAEARNAAVAASERIWARCVASATNSTPNVLPVGPAYYDNTGWHPAAAAQK